jgi:hypothetical protein
LVYLSCSYYLLLHRPNTEFHWNSEKKVEELRASSDIQEGEELTDAYLDLTAEVGGRERN